MKQYVGLDVSQKETAVCVVDESGKLIFQGKVESDPGALAQTLHKRARMPIGSVLNRGQCRAGCGMSASGSSCRLCAARPAMPMRPCRCLNKSDENDARGLAERVRIGWSREVAVKSERSQQIRSVLVTRARLVGIRRDIENQIRSMLKEYGLRFGRSIGTQFRRNAAEAIDATHPLHSVIQPLLRLHEHVCTEQDKLDRRVRQLARDDATPRRLMSVPGIGVVTALAFPPHHR